MDKTVLTVNVCQPLAALYPPYSKILGIPCDLFKPSSIHGFIPSPSAITFCYFCVDFLFGLKRVEIKFLGKFLPPNAFL